MTLDIASVTAQLTAVTLATDGDATTLTSAVRALQHRQAILDLTMLYGRAVDDHDVQALVEMFTEGGVFERRGDAAIGYDAIRAAYAASFDTYRTMLHTTHPPVVQLHDDASASGWSHGHAELATRRTLILASYRYEDFYRRVADRWLFAKRSLTFMYAVPVDQLPTSFATNKRIRWPGTEPESGDYPETARTWNTYRS